jgi:hypothetical protein
MKKHQSLILISIKVYLILIYFIIFLFRKEIKKMQEFLNEKHKPLVEERLLK